MKIDTKKLYEEQMKRLSDRTDAEKKADKGSVHNILMKLQGKS